jgi:hypothetical protein
MDEAQSALLFLGRGVGYLGEKPSPAAVAALHF